MQKVLLLLIIFSLVELTKAQTKGQMQLGMEFGPDQSEIYGSPAPINKSYTGAYALGFTAQYDFNEIFSLKSGIYNEVKGFSQSYSYVSNPASQTPFVSYINYNGLDYITIPLLMKAGFGRKLHCFANAGPYLGWLVGAPASQEYTDSLIKRQTSTGNAANLYKAVDFGVAGGAGIEIQLKNRFILSLEARYNLGLVNIDNSGFYNIKNESTDLLFGVRYRL